MIVRNARVPTGTQESDPLTIPDGYYLTRVVIPAVFASTSMKIRVSVNDGSTHQPSFVGTEYNQTIAAGNSYALDSAITKGSNSFLLDFNTNESPEKLIPCVFERF